MDTTNFLKEKGKLKELARKTVLFGLSPKENLEEFEKFVDSLIQCPGSERCIQFFINLFEEEKRELAPYIDTLRKVWLDIHTSTPE
ncbi:MAG: hypothetical protein AAB501_01370 [Patescibacteria group bacterium]